MHRLPPGRMRFPARAMPTPASNSVTSECNVIASSLVAGLVLGGLAALPFSLLLGLISPAKLPDSLPDLRL